MPKQSESDPSWLLPRLCTHSVYTIGILILFFVYSEIFLMHHPHRSIFPDVLIISIGAFSEFDHNATRDMISVWIAALQPCSDLTLQCTAQVISNLLHVIKVVFHRHTIIYVQSLCPYV
jgi:hypothetical protein